MRACRCRPEWAICVRREDGPHLRWPVFLVALAKSGAVVGQLSCDVEVAGMPGCLLDHAQDDPAQVALALVPVEAEHYSGRPVVNGYRPSSSPGTVTGGTAGREQARSLANTFSSCWVVAAYRAPRLAGQR